MIVRDVDLLVELSRVARCTVCLSVPTVDEDAWRALEPGTAHPLQRLRAVRTLRDAGINAGVLMAPVVPGFTTQTSKLDATIKAVADHGAAFLGANVLYLKGGTQGSLHGLSRPRAIRRWSRATSASTPAPTPRRSTSSAVRALIDMLKERHRVNRRLRRVTVPEPEDRATPAEPTQKGFTYR